MGQRPESQGRSENLVWAFYRGRTRPRLGQPHNSGVRTQFHKLQVTQNRSYTWGGSLLPPTVKPFRQT